MTTTGIGSGRARAVNTQRIRRHATIGLVVGSLLVGALGCTPTTRSVSGSQIVELSTTGRHQWSVRGQLEDPGYLVGLDDDGTVASVSGDFTIADAFRIEVRVGGIDGTLHGTISVEDAESGDRIIGVVDQPAPDLDGDVTSFVLRLSASTTSIYDWTFVPGQIQLKIEGGAPGEPTTTTTTSETTTSTTTTSTTTTSTTSTSTTTTSTTSTSTTTTPARCAAIGPGADLSGCVITGTTYGKNLDGANLDGAVIESAYNNTFKGASLRGATFVLQTRYGDFRGADLTGATFSGATDVTGNTFDDTTIFSTTKFRGSKGYGNKFVGADLGDSDFTDAQLTSSDLSLSDISEATFTNADISNSNLTGATLGDALDDVALICRATGVDGDLVFVNCPEGDPSPPDYWTETLDVQLSRAFRPRGKGCPAGASVELWFGKSSPSGKILSAPVDAFGRWELYVPSFNLLPSVSPGQWKVQVKCVVAAPGSGSFDYDIKTLTLSY